MSLPRDFANLHREGYRAYLCPAADGGQDVVVRLVRGPVAQADPGLTGTVVFHAGPETVAKGGRFPTADRALVAAIGLCAAINAGMAPLDLFFLARAVSRLAPLAAPGHKLIAVLPPGRLGETHWETPTGSVLRVVDGAFTDELSWPEFLAALGEDAADAAAGGT